MNVAIRPITIEDCAGFHQCLDTIAREKRYLANIAALPFERVESFVSQGIASNRPQLVAVEGDRVVGWADIIRSSADTATHCGRLGMGLLAGYRGQGLGERLLRVCIEKAWRSGITRIELEARADNASAIALYEKLGFAHEALKRDAMCFDGNCFDAVQMSLLRRDVEWPSSSGP